MTAPYYTDDHVVLFHGDCLEITDWLTADVLVTDPPYGIGWSVGDHPKRGSTARAGILNDQDTSCRDGALAAWGERPGIVFGTWAAPFPANRQTLVWRKPPDSGVVGSTTGYRRDTELIFLTGRWPKRSASRSSVIETDAGIRSYLISHPNGHPHAKPQGLMAHLIEWTAGIIADPFAGSGSTLAATKALGRKAIGVYGDHPDRPGGWLRPDGTSRGVKATSIADAQAALGIDWMTDWDDLTDAIPPAFTEYIGTQLLDALVVA